MLSLSHHKIALQKKPPKKTIRDSKKAFNLFSDFQRCLNLILFQRWCKVPSSHRDEESKMEKHFFHSLSYYSESDKDSL